MKKMSLYVLALFALAAAQPQSFLTEHDNKAVVHDVDTQEPVLDVPKSSACLSSLLKKPYFKSSAHSAYAEVFYDTEDKALASAKTLIQMVEAYAKKDPSCSLEYVPVLRDEVSCQGQVCSLPTDLGRFSVIKDNVDGAAVIYLGKSGKEASLGTAQSQTLNLSLAQPEFCYTELLNLDGRQTSQTPFDSTDHHNYFVSTKNLSLSQDARTNSVQLINRLVKGLTSQEGSACEFQTANQGLDEHTCKTLAGVDVCVIDSPKAGSFVVTKDAADGAYVTFLRYD